MRVSPARYVAVGIAGGTAFLDMYATQPLLPELRVAFGGANEATVAATVSSLSFGVALAAPLIGPLADRIGRKRVIVSAIFALAIVTFFAAQAHTLAELIAWRFVQGLAMPGIFAVTLAYIAEEFPSAVGGRAIGAYICGNVVGGFLGRYISAFVAARADWHAAFVALGALNVTGGIGVLSLMPSAQNFRARAASANAFAALGGFLRSPATLAVYGVGAAVLFTLVAAFTFATFHLAAAPYSLGTAQLGSIFFVYLFGAIAAPLAGRLIDRHGHRYTALAGIALSVTGIALTLAAPLPVGIAGLAMMSTGVFVTQAASQGYLGVVARHDRGAAAALYLTIYYSGGGLGAVLPAGIWQHGGWPATVALILVVQIAAALLARYGWQGAASRPVENALA